MELQGNANTNIESIISDTNVDIDQRIKNGVVPTHADKKRIQLRIKQLDKRQQLHLFNTIIKELEIYTVTENGTYFDLNDLTPEQFWKLHYHINLTHDCINRNKLKEELERQVHSILGTKSENSQTKVDSVQNGGKSSDAVADQNTDYFNKDYDIETTSMWNEYEPAETELENAALPVGRINYSQLREEALSHCKYSEFYKEGGELVSRMTRDHESKVIERNIYTDRRVTKKK